MGTRKRWGVLGLSVALAGVLLALTGAMLAAAGGLWAPLGTDGGGVTQLAVADTNPATLYARTGDLFQWVGPYRVPASGIWKSSDAGATWHATTLGVHTASGDSNVSLAAMAVSADGSTVCVAQDMRATLGPSPSDTRMWCSTNGGASWLSSVIPTSTVRALVVLNNAGGRVAAGSAMGNERPLFYSDDDGTSWSLATVVSTSNQINITALAEGSAYAGGEVYVSSSWRPAVFTSTDGIAWQQTFTDVTGSGRFTQIVADPTNSQRAFGMVSTGGAVGGAVFSTTNKGESWVQLPNQPSTVISQTATWLAVDSQGRVYASTSLAFLPGLSRSGKVYRSDDHGASWGLVGQTPDAKGIDSIVVDPNDDDMLYAASADSDHPVGVYRTPPGAGVSAATYSFQPSNSGMHAYGAFDVAGNSANPSVIYAATCGQGVIKSADGGNSWSRTSEGSISCASAVAVHPSNPNIAYFGAATLWFSETSNIFRTTDGGNVWKPGGAGIPGALVVTDLAIDPTSPGTVYAAGWPGGIVKSTDSGGSWASTAVVTPAYAVAIHPTTPNTLYVAVNNAVVPAPGVPALYKSTDGGTSVIQMAVVDDCVSDALVNPNAPNEVYGVSCYGMFLKSIDDGTIWTTVSLTQALGTGNFPYNILGLGVPRLGYDSQAGILYASFGVYGLLASHDGGGAWGKVADAPDMAMYSPFYQPGNNTLYVGGSNGLWRRPSSTYLPAIKKDAS